MILIDEDHVWEISDPKVYQALGLSSASAKGRLTTKQKCVLNQILDKFRNTKTKEGALGSGLLQPRSKKKTKHLKIKHRTLEVHASGHSLM